MRDAKQHKTKNTISASLFDVKITSCLLRHKQEAMKSTNNNNIIEEPNKERKTVTHQSINQGKGKKGTKRRQFVFLLFDFITTQANKAY